jgi:hypothetical protein
MTEGQFLVGAFQMSATIWDRMDATVEISREHSDYFIRNTAAPLELFLGASLLEVNHGPTQL